MNSPDNEAVLHRALDLCGVQPEYWDIFGRQQHASHKTKLAILKSLGMDCGSDESLERSIQDRLLSGVGRLLPWTAVTGQAGAIGLSIPSDSTGKSLHIDLHWENGGITSRDIELAHLARIADVTAGGRHFAGLALPLAVLADGDVPLGYHRVTARLDQESWECWLIVTPERAWLPDSLEHGGKRAGLAVQLYGLRSTRNWGCGDFSDIPAAARWAAAMGGSFLALNPLHAIHNRRPFNTSPYLPYSLLYRNFLYLDLERLPEFHACPRTLREFRGDAVQGELGRLRETGFIEYERIAALKIRFLRIAYVHGTRYGSIDRNALRGWIEQQGETLQRFATYCALDEFLHRRNPDVWIWPDWPEEYRDPASPAVAQFQQRHARNVEFYCYLQWRIDQQAEAAQQAARDAGLEIGLYHDLPLATDRYGCELWAHRDLYVAGCRVGSPPDDFSPDGQDWGFPPPDREAHIRSGYRHIIATIRAAVRHGGALRLDHVMRLFRLYWIPDGIGARDGAYVRDHWEDLIRILVLESLRGRFLIVGEDLGTVEPWVRDALARFGILSYRLLYFERGEGGRFKQPGEYPESALVSTTTHDLPTLAGFWTGGDIHARHAVGVLDDEGMRNALRDRESDKDRLIEALHTAGLLDGGDHREWSDEVRLACIAYLAKSPATLLAINQEDLTGEVAQQNLPGTTAQYPNWARKMRETAEEMTANPVTASVSDVLRRTGRVPKA